VDGIFGHNAMLHVSYINKNVISMASKLKVPFTSNKKSYLLQDSININ